jgi:hypothetical protein
VARIIHSGQARDEVLTVAQLQRRIIGIAAPMAGGTSYYNPQYQGQHCRKKLKNRDSFYLWSLSGL